MEERREEKRKEGKRGEEKRRGEKRRGEEVREEKKKIRQVEKNASKGSHMWIMMSANAGRQTHTDNPSDTQIDR